MSIFDGDDARYNFPCGQSEEEPKTVWVLTVGDDTDADVTVGVFSEKGKIFSYLAESHGADMSSEDLATLFEEGVVEVTDDDYVTTHFEVTEHDVL